MFKNPDNLTYDFEIIGQCHLPNSEHKVPGIFRFKENLSIFYTKNMERFSMFWIQVLLKYQIEV